MPISDQWQKHAAWVLKTDDCLACEGFGLVVSKHAVERCGACNGVGRVAKKVTKPKKKRK